MFTLTSAKNDIAIDHHLSNRDKRMKIKCDVCDKSEASVFCSADEAALCDACDRHVHHANKLASKHHRFSLIQPSSKESPLCDICQERRAFLFCQEDRAILCRECDIPIHKANEHTRKHNRFLLTGVKLSRSSSTYSSCFEYSKKNSTATSNKKSLQQQHNNNNTPSFSNEMLSCLSVERASSSPSLTAAYNYNNNYNNLDDNVSVSISSISDYLETLPGWRVDDFLDPSTATDGFCQTFSNFLPLMDPQDLDQNQMDPFSPEDSTFWVPQVSPHDHQPPVNNCNLLPMISSTTNTLLLDRFMLRESKSEASNCKDVNRKWSQDSAFTVPEMSFRPVKISRHNIL